MIDMLRSSSVLSRRSHRFVKAMHALQHLREADLEDHPLLGYREDGAKERLARLLDMAGKGALAFRLTTEEAAAELENIADKTPAADECIHRKYTRNRLEACISQLSEKEQVVIREYYFEDRTFVDIGKRNNGLNKSWISKLHSRALGKLRVLLDAEEL
jgi:RNA polymerase sigma factor (sigma-70 family)